MMLSPVKSCAGGVTSESMLLQLIDEIWLLDITARVLRYEVLQSPLPHILF